MDPNECLRRCRRLAKKILKDSHRECVATDKGETLAEYFENLDEWLSNGGFLPEEWSN